MDILRCFWIGRRINKNQKEDVMLNTTIKCYITEKVKKQLLDKTTKIQAKKPENITTEDENILALYEEVKDLEELSYETYADWILSVSKIAVQRRFCTHISKFIHPDANVSCLITNLPKESDGYIRTGNVEDYIDSYGNAAAMPASDLMNLIVDDLPLRDHIRKETIVSKEFFAYLRDKSTEVKQNFQKMLTDEIRTDFRIRQIYLPTNDQSYVLATPLFSVPVLHELNTKIRENTNRLYNPTNSTEKNHKTAYAYKKENLFLDDGYWILPTCMNTSYGGSQPQNISTFNLMIKEHTLLKSMPPSISKRTIRIPKHSFFTDSIYIQNPRYIELFEKLDRIFHLDEKNKQIKETRDKYLLSILSEISIDIATVRYEISKVPKPNNIYLPEAELIMLYKNEERFNNEEWQKDIALEFARWFMDFYKRNFKNAISFSDYETSFIQNFAFDHKEMFIQ